MFFSEIFFPNIFLPRNFVRTPRSGAYRTSSIDGLDSQLPLRPNWPRHAKCFEMAGYAGVKWPLPVACIPGDYWRLALVHLAKTYCPQEVACHGLIDQHPEPVIFKTNHRAIIPSKFFPPVHGLGSNWCRKSKQRNNSGGCNGGLLGRKWLGSRGGRDKSNRNTRSPYPRGQWSGCRK